MTAAPPSLDDFMTVANARLCVDVFSRYMREKFAFDVNEADIDVKKLVFKVMTQVHRHTLEVVGPDAPVDMKRLNNLTLNAARDFYVQEYKLDDVRRMESISLHRDKTTAEVQGLSMPPPPERPDTSGAVLDRSPPIDYDAILQEREQRSSAALSPTSLPQALSSQSVKELDCEAPDALLERMTVVEQTRQADETKMLPPLAQSLTVSPDVEVDDGSGGTIITRRNDRRVFPRYISVNGFDRNWDIYKQRFSFAIDVPPTNHREIHSIGVTSMVIPMEITDTASISNIPKVNYRHMFSFAFPYVIVNIDEFSDIYESGTDISKRAFCQMVFESSYESQSGRGYVVLKPMQRERKHFYPAPLVSFNRMTLSILRPNGVLFNQSTDGHRVANVQWERTNATDLLVTMTTFRDKNEIYTGDTVRMKDVVFAYNDAALADRTVASNNPTPQNSTNVLDPWVQHYYYEVLATFINRPEGHEVTNMGKPNAKGYYNNFYIQAPGTFDDSTGDYLVPSTFLTLPPATVVTNNDIYSQTVMGALGEWNDARWQPAVNKDFRVGIGNGGLINMSLQVAITVQLMTTVDDAGFIRTTAPLKMLYPLSA